MLSMLSNKEKEQLFVFVENSVKNYDSSHNFEHAKDVLEMSKQIAKYEKLNIEENVFGVAALVHDVCDHKYIDRGSISKEELIEFLKNLIGETNSNRVMNIVNNVSWSKQKENREKGNIPKFVNPTEKQWKEENKEICNFNLSNGFDELGDIKLQELDNTYLQIIRDADRIMSLGLKGIERINDYVKALNPNIEEKEIKEHTIKLCYNRLLVLIDEGYIVTELGRKLSIPLMEEIIDWLNIVESE